VDGVWRHDENAPFMPDPNGNVNNWVFVRLTAGEVDRNYLLQQRYFLQELQNQIAEQLSARAPVSEDVPMRDDIPRLLTDRKEPEYTLHVIHDFLHTHKAFELIPESGKVVVLDIDLSVRQAFHALYEQCIPSASLWDSREKSIVGVISASDFIQALKQLRESFSSGANALTAAEMDRHTIRNLKQEANDNGSHQADRFVYIEPEATLEDVVNTLIDKRCSTAPIVAIEARKIPTVLHTATLGGVVSCLIRHFQASISSLPFLSRPLSALHVGTWSPTAPFASEAPDDDPRCRRKTEVLKVIRPDTLLIDALNLLLEADVSALPVVDNEHILIDIYARTDITHLAKNHAYTRLQQEELTVHQALTIGREAPAIPEQFVSTGGVVGGLTATFRNLRGSGSGSGPAWTSSSLHLHSVTRNDTLRTVVERLANPGIHRLMVIDPTTRVLEGIISLTDIAKYLFLLPQIDIANERSHSLPLQ